MLRGKIRRRSLCSRDIRATLGVHEDIVRIFGKFVLLWYEITKRCRIDIKLLKVLDLKKLNLGVGEINRYFLTFIFAIR